MSRFELVMPKLGESVSEATITKWFVKPGDVVEEEQSLLEIATDKVDSEIPSPVDGKIIDVLFEEDSMVSVGEVIAIIGDEDDEAATPGKENKPKPEPAKESAGPEPEKSEPGIETGPEGPKSSRDRFYSPLVKSIARKEGISQQELDSIKGTGHKGRVKKEDILAFIGNRVQQPATASAPVTGGQPVQAQQHKVNVSIGAEDQIIKMDRMRKIIAEHMVTSKHVSPHVTNMLEADVTDVVLWRNKVKDGFQQREGEKITYLPVFLEAIAKSLKDFPGVNSSVDGDNIILRKNINLGVAVALPTGNLIVPVIRNADQLNLVGLTKELNRLAKAARENKLQPDEIQGGTFSISNFGTFRNLTGTPIINQPQAAILAIGTIEKKPAVIETPQGDTIGIRHKMFLSLTYDHRIIDGALGGGFLRRVADYIEDFDINRTI